MNEKPIAFVSLVKLLEQAVGKKTNYKLLNPFPCETLKNGRPEVVTIQKAGRTIAQHLGLDEFLFIIAVVPQKPCTAAHIELDRTARDVFVEISPDLCEYGDAVLATLCHELSHKFLHKHDIRNGTTALQQEFLTDVTAVYLGMGKIMLNGCHCQISKTTTTGGQTWNETSAVDTGYISRDCFAFVYRLVCAMRGIPRDVFLSGLSAAAKQAVQNAESQYADWFKSELSNVGGAALLVEGFATMVESCHDDLASRHRILRIVQKRIDSLTTSINESHTPLKEVQGQIAKISAIEPNPHLRFLNCLQTRESIVEALHRRDLQMKDALSGWVGVEELAAWARQTTPQSDSDIVECPLDGTKLRVPGDRKRLLVTCPSCKYKFVVNTARVTESSHRGKNRTHSFKWRFYPAVACFCVVLSMVGYVAGRHSLTTEAGYELSIVDSLSMRFHGFLANHFSGSQ